MLDDLAVGQCLTDLREILLKHLLGLKRAPHGCEPDHSRKGGERR